MAFVPETEHHAKNRKKMKKYFVYVLYSEKSGKFYIGSTADPEGRLKAHNAGRGGWTKSFRPWKRILPKIDIIIWIGKMAERSNAAVSKTVVRLTADRGFESPSFRQSKSCA
jgi:predicted GIY-YIG superfamily endonuclease